MTSTGAFKAWASLAVAIVGIAVTMVMGLTYINRVDQAAERRNVERQRQICGIVVIIDDRNQQMPPSTDPATTEFRRELHAYRISLGC